MCVCVCVCVCKRERNRVRERVRGRGGVLAQWFCLVWGSGLGSAAYPPLSCGYLGSQATFRRQGHEASKIDSLQHDGFTGFRTWDVGVIGWDLGVGVQGLVVGVLGSEVGVEGLGFEV